MKNELILRKPLDVKITYLMMMISSILIYLLLGFDMWLIVVTPLTLSFLTVPIARFFSFGDLVLSLFWWPFLIFLENGKRL
jgi:hypothetical protein